MGKISDYKEISTLTGSELLLLDGVGGTKNIKTGIFLNALQNLGGTTENYHILYPDNPTNPCKEIQEDNQLSYSIPESYNIRKYILNKKETNAEIEASVISVKVRCAVAFKHTDTSIGFIADDKEFILYATIPTTGNKANIITNYSIKTLEPSTNLFVDVWLKHINGKLCIAVGKNPEIHQDKHFVNTPYLLRLEILD